MTGFPMGLRRSGPIVEANRHFAANRLCPNRDRGRSNDRTPPTPPGMRVRTGRFEKLRYGELYSPCSLVPTSAKAAAGSPVRLAMRRQLGFITLSLRRGFTAPFFRTPLPAFRRSGLLMHCLAKPHVASLSFSFGPSPCLLAFKRAPATTTSADFSLQPFGRHPFRHEARSPQVRTQSFPAQPPDLRRLTLDHKSFAVTRLLALVGFALYPILVHRLAVSLHASSPRSVTLTQLRFASLTVVSSRDDFYLQDRAHAGRTNEMKGKAGALQSVRLSDLLGVIAQCSPTPLHPFLNKKRQSINDFIAEDNFVNVTHMKHVNHSA